MRFLEEEVRDDCICAYIPPTKQPTSYPTHQPTTAYPTNSPTISPTKEPTLNPTFYPTHRPYIKVTTGSGNKYITGMKGKMECPSGSNFLSGEDECKEAATALTESGFNKTYKYSANGINI